MSIFLAFGMALLVDAGSWIDAGSNLSGAPGGQGAGVRAGPAPFRLRDRVAESEQLRLFDAPLPVARISVASRLAAAPAPRLCPSVAVSGVIERAYNLRPGLLQLVVSEESAGNPWARSRKGARGLMQVMPATAARFGVTAARLDEPFVNLATGAAELRRLELRFDGDLSLALAAYNAGEGAVRRHGGRVPPYPETRTYVARVLSRLAQSAPTACARGRRD